jgi:hypothetical protein
MRQQEEKLVQLLLKEQGEEDKLKILKKGNPKTRSVWGTENHQIFECKISYKEETNWLEKNLYIAVIL